jgi:hypothetical protein
MFPVNRLAEAAYCGACGHDFPIAEGVWSALLREAIVHAPGLAQGDTASVAAGALRLSYKRIAFGCLSCGKAFASGDAPGAREDRCGGCGRPLSLREVASTAYASFLGELSHLYGEQPGRGDPSAAATSEVAQFPCASCGAALLLDGTTQSVICTYCRRPSHVPLRFLYRGHRDVPEPWGALFGSPLPPKSTELGAVFDWVCLETELPFAASLAHGRVLLSATYRDRSLDAQHNIKNTQERALVALVQREGSFDPALLWQRRDLFLATATEKRPFFVVPGAERVFVRTHAGIVVLDAQTGDTVRILPVDAPESDYFASPALAMPEDRVLRAPRGTLALAVGDASTTLAAGYRGDAATRAWVTVTNAGGEVQTRGEITLKPDDDRDTANLRVSQGTGPAVWLQVDRAVYRGAPEGGKVKLERVPDVRLAGTARRPFVAVAFGDGVAAIGDHGAFRVFDREGKLQFDAASLPKPTKKSDAELAKEMGDAIMARGMAEHDAAQAAADLAAENDARARRAKGVKALLIAGAVVALLVLALSVLSRI